MFRRKAKEAELVEEPVEKPQGALVPTWVYPKDGSAPRIEQLPEGAKPPKGCQFSPVKGDD
jgi:hypothetical protein